MYYMRVEVEQVRFKNGFKLYKSWLDGVLFYDTSAQFWPFTRNDTFPSAACSTKWGMFSL